MCNRYNRRNRRKYSLKVHIVLVTKYRKPLLKDAIANDVKQTMFDVCKAHNYSILAMETDVDHLHILLGYDTVDRVCDIVKQLKQHSTFYVWQKHHSTLSRRYWKKCVLWSDGYFACSIGEVSSATIQRYIENQG